MDIILIGLNHKTAPVEVRERFCIPQERVRAVLVRLGESPGFLEGMILSTCNRMEVLAVVEGGDGPIDAIREELAATAGMERKEVETYLYLFKGEEAIRHLFRVASSLDSMILGEPQILGQVKEAYSQAVENMKAGLVLNKLFHRAFFVAKRVRTETKIASQAVSVGFAAVELAKKILGDLSDKRAMLIGAGEMSELAARHLMGQGVREILVANRTYSRAQELAREFQGEAVPFAEFLQQLKKVDIVISSTGSAEYIIRQEQLAGVIRARKNRPMFFIDIAVPRDVDPKINEMDNVYVYDIDDLQGIVESNREARQKEIRMAEAMITEGVEGIKRWLISLDVVPTIVDLRRRMEEIRQREVEKTLAQLKDPSPEERRAIDLLTNAIINKILHPPISFLKHQDTHSQGKLYIELTRKIFQLDTEKDEDSKA